jgi:glycosyltransferase 2 family protein
MSNKLLKFAKEWWHYLIGFIIFAFLLTQIDISSTFDVLSSANMLLVIVGLLMVVPMFVFKAVRWRYMMAQQNIHYSLKDSIAMYFAAMYIGFVTPGRVAELLKAAYLMKDGHSFGKSIFSVFFDRFADLIFLAALGYAGLFIFPELFQKQIFWLSLIAMIEFVVAIVVILKREFAKTLLQKVLKKIAPKNLKQSVESQVEDFYEALKIFNIRTTFMIFFYTSLSYFFYFVMAILLAEAVGIHIDYVYIIVSIIIVSLVAVIPVSIAGVGTREATLLLMLGALGIASETILAYSVLNLIGNLLVIVMAAPFWFKKPVKF